jgi:hypothetical protein
MHVSYVYTILLVLIRPGNYYILRIVAFRVER